MTLPTPFSFKSTPTPSLCPGLPGLRYFAGKGDLRTLSTWFWGRGANFRVPRPFLPLDLSSLYRAAGASCGPQVGAAYLGRTGPGAEERRRARRVARGLAHPGRARVTARGGGCGGPARSCQALQPCAGLATPASDCDRTRRRAMSSRLRPLLRASPRPRGHPFQAPGSAPGTLAPHAC